MQGLKKRRSRRSSFRGSTPQCGTLKSLDVGSLRPTPDNKRDRITNASVASLAASIKRHGVLQPLVVRKHPSEDGAWEIRAGERRWRAAKVAGLTHVPCLVRVLSDEEALGVTLAENMQREDPHPLALAATVQQAIDRGYDLKAIASQVGKSLQTVVRLASLTNLSESWRSEVTTQDSDASLLSIAHLELLARLPASAQDALAEDGCRAVFGSGIPSVDELRRITERGMHTLRSFAWPLDDATLLPEAGACMQCPKRSGAQPMLFDQADAPQDGRVSKTDRCLDAACRGRKEAAYLERREGELREKHPDLKLVQLTYNGLGEETKSKLGERATRMHDVDIVKRGTQGATPALALDGPKAGSLVYIRKQEPTEIPHRRSQRPVDASGNPMPLTLAERQDRVAKRRAAWLVNAVLQELRKLTPAMCESFARGLAERQDATAKRFNPLALIVSFGTFVRADRNDGHEAWASYKSLLEGPPDELVGAMIHDVVRVWSQRLARFHPSTVVELAEDARRICCIVGWNWFEFELASRQAVPTPKAWRGQVREVAPVPRDEFGQEVLNVKSDKSGDVAEDSDIDSENAAEEPPFDVDEEHGGVEGQPAKPEVQVTARRDKRQRGRSKRRRAAAAA